MVKVLLDQLIFTQYGQFDLVWGDFGFDGDWDLHFAGQVNGLAGAAAGSGVYLNLARRSGGSWVQVLLYDEAPGELGDVWDDVVEVSVQVPVGVPVEWWSWGNESVGTLDLPPGSYRVRVSAQGRDAGAADEQAEGVVDRYLAEFWPGEAQTDRVVKVNSRNAAEMHREVGSRR